MSDKSCVFCKIIARDIPAPLIVENEYAIAFADREPVAPVHILVVPRIHIQSIVHVTHEHEKVIAGMVDLIQQLAQTHGNSSDKGFNLEVNTGASAGQSVFHMHWHFKAGCSF